MSASDGSWPRGKISGTSPGDSGSLHSKKDGTRSQEGPEKPEKSKVYVEEAKYGNLFLVCFVCLLFFVVFAQHPIC